MPLPPASIGRSKREAWFEGTRRVARGVGADPDRALTTLPVGMRCIGRSAAALLVVVLCAVPGEASPAAAEEVRRPVPVVLLLVRELTWAGAPAALDGFAKANLSMRTAGARSQAADVYLTLGKGGRSGGLPEGAGVGRVEPAPDGGLRLVDWPELQDRDDDLRYGGALGSVGESLRRHGRRWALVSDDPEAAAAAATADGTVPRAYPGTPDGVAGAIGADLDAILVAVNGADVERVLPLLDGYCTVVASASTADESRHLGVLATSPACGLGTAGLASSATHHDHLAALPDVSRMFLALVGAPPLATVAGGEVTATGPVERRTLVDRDRRTWTADRSRTPFVWMFVVLHAVGAVIAIRWRRARPVVACALLAIPPASFLMMLVPWWKGGAAVGLLAGGLLAGAIALGGTLVARRDPVLGIGALAAFTAAVIAVDALFASPLQIDAPFGNSPVVAGRFFGMGNIGSGFLARRCWSRGPWRSTVGAGGRCRGSWPR